MGGTVDPKTGKLVWEMHVPLADQLTHYRAHPPRALETLRVTPCEADWQFDGHGEPVNVVFEIACPCGGTRFHVSCGVAEDETPCPPITLACAQCLAEHEIFDAAKHGYDAELNSPPLEQPPAFDDLESDIASPHEIVVRYEYCSEQLANPHGDVVWRGREQDLFSWFTVLGRDPDTKRLTFLYESECA